MVITMMMVTMIIVGKQEESLGGTHGRHFDRSLLVHTMGGFGHPWYHGGNCIQEDGDHAHDSQLPMITSSGKVEGDNKVIVITGSSGGSRGGFFALPPSLRVPSTSSMVFFWSWKGKAGIENVKVNVFRLLTCRYVNEI